MMQSKVFVSDRVKDYFVVRKVKYSMVEGQILGTGYRYGTSLLLHSMKYVAVVSVVALIPSWPMRKYPK